MGPAPIAINYSDRRTGAYFWLSAYLRKYIKKIFERIVVLIFLTVHVKTKNKT